MTGLINTDVVNSFQPKPQEQENPWSGMLQQITPGSTFSARGGFKLPGSDKSTDLSGVTQNIQGMQESDVNMGKSDLGYSNYMKWQESQNNPAGPNFKPNAWNSMATQSNLPEQANNNLFGALTGVLGKQNNNVMSSSLFGI